MPRQIIELARLLFRPIATRPRFDSIRRPEFANGSFCTAYCAPVITAVSEGVNHERSGAQCLVSSTSGGPCVASVDSRSGARHLWASALSNQVLEWNQIGGVRSPHNSSICRSLENDPTQIQQQDRQRRVPLAAQPAGTSPVPHLEHQIDRDDARDSLQRIQKDTPCEA
jgi:hypothetical protein